MAFLYQLIPKLGTLGGIRLKDPLIEMCGSAKCGRLHVKLNAPLIVLIAFVTVDLTDSKMLVNLDLILPSTLDTVEYAALMPLEMALFTPLIAFVTVLLIAFQAFEKTLLTLLNTALTIAEIADNADWITDVIVFQIVLATPKIALSAPDQLPCSIAVNAVTTPCITDRMPDTVVRIAPHTVDATVDIV
jgi:hypothetical protein